MGGAGPGAETPGARRDRYGPPKRLSIRSTRRLDYFRFSLFHCAPDVHFLLADGGWWVVGGASSLTCEAAEWPLGLLCEGFFSVGFRFSTDDGRFRFWEMWRFFCGFNMMRIVLEY